MNFKQLSVFAYMAASFSAMAQMPVPLMDAGGSESGKAREQLESIFQCPRGVSFSGKNVEQLFAAIGLVKGKDQVFLPGRSGPKVTLLGDEVLAAMVHDLPEEKKATVYFKSQTAKQLGNKMKVTKVDEQANTDDASYFRSAGKSTALVGAASELDVGNASVKYASAIACQVKK